MSRPKILLYLHHVELGQRYPISDQEVVIGRSVGHILFPKDERLSAQHCRIFLGPKGMCVQDLSSANGTVVDGRLLSPQKSYPVREGTLIAAGGQVFKCVEPSNPRHLQPKRKKKRRKSDSEFDFTPIFFVLCLCLASYVGYKYQHLVWPHFRQAAPPPPPILSPFEIVYSEIEEAYAAYRDMGRIFQEGKLTNKELATEMRKNLIPKLTAAQAKVAVLKPSSELEGRRIETNKRLINALLAQVTAMVKFTETNDPKYSRDLDHILKEVEIASEEARRVNSAARAPTAESN